MYCKRAAVALLLLTGCKSSVPPAGILQRTAVLRFENLSGSESEDWQGRAISELLKRRFHAERMPVTASAAPGLSTERLAAISAGATQLITGYYTGQGDTLTVAAFAEDTATQKISSPVYATGSLQAISDAIARQLDASESPLPKIAAAALKQYALANDSGLPDSLDHYDQALKADPNLGPAYIGLIRAAMASNDVARSEAVLTAASTHAANFTAQDRADLQLESATLSRNAPARLQALEAELSLNGYDSEILRTLADAELSSRKAASAARHFRQLAALSPADANIQNLIAYASLAAGDEKAARAAAVEYKRLRPQDPNAFDTQGDVELAFGNFAEAEKAYLASPDPSFQDFSPTWKAAHARLFSGDLTGASAIFEQHRKALVSSGNQAAGYRSAEWLYLTGHRAKALTVMSALAAKVTQPELRSLAYTQAAIWAVMQQDNADAIKFSDLALHPPQNSTFLLAALVRFLAQPAATAPEWQHRAETNFKGQNLTEVRSLALALALTLSNTALDALPVWKHVYENTPVTDATPLYLYGWSLLETGHPAEARPLFRLNPIPSPGITPSFEGLYLPAVFEWRKRSLRQ